MTQFATYKEWKAAVAQSGLTVEVEHGYTEDLNATSFEFAVNAKGETVGHYFGGPEVDSSAALFGTADEWLRYMNEDEHDPAASQYLNPDANR